MAQDILTELGVDGQSSEYTDNEDEEGRDLKSLRPEYRNKAVDSILHDVDAKGQALERDESKKLKSQPSKKPAKSHRVSQEVSPGPPVKGLPRYCYDTEYLSGLTGFQQEILGISEEKRHPLFEEWAASEGRG